MPAGDGLPGHMERVLAYGSPSLPLTKGLNVRNFLSFPGSQFTLFMNNEELELSVLLF